MVNSLFNLYVSDENKNVYVYMSMWTHIVWCLSELEWLYDLFAVQETLSHESLHKEMWDQSRDQHKKNYYYKYKIQVCKLKGVNRVRPVSFIRSCSILFPALFSWIVTSHKVLWALKWPRISVLPHFFLKNIKDLCFNSWVIKGLNIDMLSRT